MEVSWKLVGTLAIAAALALSGCGGGGGSGGGSTGAGGSGSSGGSGEAEVSVELRGADWAAYAASDWQRIDLDALGEDKIFTFTPGADGKYGVAIHCADSGSEVVIYQATREEMPAITGECVDEEEIAYEVNGTIEGLQGNMTAVAMRGDYAPYGIPQNGVFTYTLDSVSPGTNDLAVADIAFTREGQEIVQFGIKRDIAVNGNLSDLDLDLASEGIAATKHTFAVAGMGTVTFVTKNGAALFVGLDDNGDGIWYALQNGTIEGDVYSFMATSEDERKTIFETKTATTGGENVNYDPDQIAPFKATASRPDNQQILFTNLAYVPADNSPALRLYELTLEQGEGNDAVEYEISITPGWLGQNTEYTVPIEALLAAGMDQKWTFGDATIEWTAMAGMANHPLAEVNENAHEDEEENLFFTLPGLLVHLSTTGGSIQ